MTQFRQAEFNLSTATAAVRVGAAKGDDQFFSTLELAPQLGRVIKSEDNQPGRDHVAVISQSLWHSQFNNDANILTRSITLDGNAYRIIGVMPPDVQYPTTSELPYGNASIHHTDIWIPLALTPKEAADRENPNFYAIARLKRISLSLGRKRRWASSCNASTSIPQTFWAMAAPTDGLPSSNRCAIRRSVPCAPFSGCCSAPYAAFC
jgi:MacB-like protein